MAKERAEQLSVRAVEDSAEGRVIRYKRKKYLVLDKHRASLVRPAQYPIFDRRYEDSFLLKLRNVDTGAERKIVLHSDGSIDEVEFDMKNRTKKTKGKKQ